MSKTSKIDEKPIPDSRLQRLKAARNLIEYITRQPKRDHLIKPLMTSLDPSDRTWVVNYASPDNSSQTPLHLAIRANKIPVVRCLVENGALIDKADGNGKTPLQLAKRSPEIYDILSPYQSRDSSGNKESKSPRSKLSHQASWNSTPSNSPSPTENKYGIRKESGDENKQNTTAQARQKNLISPQVKITLPFSRWSFFSTAQWQLPKKIDLNKKKARQKLSLLGKLFCCFWCSPRNNPSAQSSRYNKSDHKSANTS